MMVSCVEGDHMSRRGHVAEGVSHPTSRVSPCVFFVVSVLISLLSQHMSQTHQRIRVGSSRVPKRAHAMHTVVVSSNMVAEPGWSSEQISERICEQIADVHVSQVVKRTIEVPKMAEQILDVPVPVMVEQKLPETVSEDRIQQRTAEHISVIPVPQDMKKLVEVSEVFQKGRIQQRFVEQADETSDISLAVKIVERPVTQMQQVANTSVQQVVDTVIQEEINQVTRHVEIPPLQFTDKVADIPVVAQKQISMVLTVQKSIEISQLQITDKVTDVPVVSVVQVPRVWVVKKTVEDSQFEIVEKPLRTQRPRSPT